MKERGWTLGDTKVDELYEYKNLGVLKNYAGSFTSNILDNIEKTRKKAGMIFSSDFDRRKTKPLIYIKFWKQACLPCLLFGDELFSLNKSQLCQLELEPTVVPEKRFLCAQICAGPPSSQNFES